MYKIFIVEDDPVFGEALERQLSHRGYQVWLVQDFQYILAQFEAYQPHLVLLDVFRRLLLVRRDPPGQPGADFVFNRRRRRNQSGPGGQ